MKDELYMQRALMLAKMGQGRVSPNPMVGCVIVHKDQIIGEGMHQYFGGPHAEVNAINSVSDKSVLAKSILYVNMEPCCFEGKTPACTSLLVHHQIDCVVIGMLDPNPRVAGKGVEILSSKGINVEVGVLGNACRQLNRRFITMMTVNRPYIILKWAHTPDGFMARENHDSKWISNAYSRKLVHKWRSQEDAILVGNKTVHFDNPRLTTRSWHGNDPLRIVLDRKLSLKDNYKIFDQPGKTLVYNMIKNDSVKNTEYVKIAEKAFLDNVLKDLKNRDIGSVIVEGGAEILRSFIQESLWDEARIFTGSEPFVNGIKSPCLPQGQTEYKLIDDTLSILYNFQTNGH